MKLKDLKISTQLQAGIGVILLLVALLGATAWFRANSMWQETKGLYEHPFAVRLALGEIKANALTIHRDMRSLILADNEQELQEIKKDIDTCEARIPPQFQILYERYLGPRKDIDEARDAFAQWTSIRDETLRLLQNGNAAEAKKRVKPGGVGNEHAQALLAKLDTMSEFAAARATRFYEQASRHRDDSIHQLWLTLGIIFLLLTGIGVLLYRRIRDPLKEIGAAVEQFRQGKLDARSSYTSANEFGALSDAFNEMAANFQIETEIKENAAVMVEAMSQVESLHSFCQTLLTELLHKTGSQVGAVYFLNEQKSHFEHFESIGLSAEGRKMFSVLEREGEFGVVLATRQIQHITDIPKDTRLVFSTVSGDFRPREIITIPINTNEHVVAVISLANTRPYSAVGLRLVNNILAVMTARINGVLVLKRIRDFSQKLEHQNRELDAQKTEMALQSEELSEQNMELELQKRQLDDANRLKSSFLSNMSHELRTPLNSVIALAGVLNRRLANTIPEEEYGYLDVIERNGKILLGLINDILDLSRIESGLEEINLSRISVKELVTDLVAMIAPQADEKHIALVNKVSEGLPPIRTDLTKCRHILQNLIANAVKFTPEGSVKISAAVVGDAIHISVADTGIGIAEDQIQYIFDEFRQADESTTRTFGGTGLGLSIAKKYATLLHGNITVQSTPGKGSVFTCVLPLTINGFGTQEAAGFGKPAQVSDLSSLPSGKGKLILVVEDSAPAVIQLKDILTGKGYRVQVARNGREAIEQIDKVVPDAMILDLMMPEVDGFDVLKTIRSMEQAVHIPVLILTAKHVTREELSFLKNNHIYQLIQKGDINKDGLLAEINAMVNPAKAQATEPASPKPAAPEKKRSGKPLVLIAEDNLDNLKTLKALLMETCNVIEATNGQIALEQARAHIPDIILMDISMPVMDGFKALEAIRKDEALRHIPVVAVTASAMAGNREEILSHGFDAYLSKPISWTLLEQEINKIRHAKP